jgi:hypothetical protein
VKREEQRERQDERAAVKGGSKDMTDRVGMFERLREVGRLRLL